MKSWFASIPVALSIALIFSVNVCKAEESGSLYPHAGPVYDPWNFQGGLSYGTKSRDVEWYPEESSAPEPPTEAPTPEPSEVPASIDRQAAASASSKSFEKKKKAKSLAAAKEAYKGVAHGKNAKAAKSKHASNSHLSASSGSSNLRGRKYYGNEYAKVKTAKNSRKRLLSIFKKKAADISKNFAHSSEYGKQKGDAKLSKDVASKKLDKGSSSASKKGAAASKEYGLKKGYFKSAGKSSAVNLYTGAADKSAKYARKATLSQGGSGGAEQEWKGE